MSRLPLSCYLTKIITVKHLDINAYLNYVNKKIQLVQFQNSLYLTYNSSL